MEYPLDEKVPAVQEVLLLEHEADPALECSPIAHSVQLDKPIVEAYVPEAHGEQLVAPALDAYVPSRQYEQTVADTLEYFPAAQIPVTADNPVVAQYEPAVQALHAPLNPAAAANVPMEQLVQLD